MALQLKFLDEVSDTVQTGTEIRGKDNECLKVALLDADGHIVASGLVSSARLEIVLLDENVADGGDGINLENFQSRIIRAVEKKKPHFAKNVILIDLHKGVAILVDLKLGHSSEWTPNCQCRLGATIAQNLGGIVVEEAWTAPFFVTDKRSKQYGKHRPPKPSSEVWRLDSIGRNGPPCKRLEDKNIKIVQDFLFWFNLNPEGLKQILNFHSAWKTITAHAETCIYDDEVMFSHKSSTEPQLWVVYDTMGILKGVVVYDSHFVPIVNMSSDEKDDAHKLLSSLLEGSAFGERYKMPFNIEVSLVKCSNQDQTATDGGPSSQIIDMRPNVVCFAEPSHSHGTRDLGELCNLSYFPFHDPNIADITPSEMDKGKCDASAFENSMDIFSDTNNLLQQQYLSGGASEMGGESSSRRSNNSFRSFNDSSRENFFFDDDWVTVDTFPAPLSPNLMLYYSDETYSPSCNNLLSFVNESCADALDTPQPQPQVDSTDAASPEPQLVDSSGNESGAAASLTNTTCGNETGASSDPHPPRVPNASQWKSSLSKLVVSMREKMSLDIFHSNKKRRID